MTLYELLHEVTFDEIAPNFVYYNYFNIVVPLAKYKMHYDMLRQLSPLRTNVTDKVITIGQLWHDKPEENTPPMCDDLYKDRDWEVNLAKEIVWTPMLLQPHGQR